MKEKHQIPDSLVFSLVGDYSADILITPMIFSHQVKQTKDKLFQRKLVIHLKAWEIQSQSLILESWSTAIHQSELKKDLALPAQLLEAGLLTLSQKLLSHPFSTLTPQSHPDY